MPTATPVDRTPGPGHAWRNTRLQTSRPRSAKTSKPSKRRRGKGWRTDPDIPDGQAVECRPLKRVMARRVCWLHWLHCKELAARGEARRWTRACSDCLTGIGVADSFKKHRCALAFGTSTLDSTDDGGNEMPRIKCAINRRDAHLTCDVKPLLFGELLFIEHVDQTRYVPGNCYAIYLFGIGTDQEQICRNRLNQSINFDHYGIGVLMIVDVVDVDDDGAPIAKIGGVRVPMTIFGSIDTSDIDSTGTVRMVGRVVPLKEVALPKEATPPVTTHRDVEQGATVSA
jgi:hypothetical protein